MPRPVEELLVAGTATAVVADARAGVSSGAITSMNWARWEYMISVQQRTQAWRTAGGLRSPNSRRRIWDSKDQEPRVQWFSGARTGRMKAALHCIQGYRYTVNVAKVQEELNQFMSRQIDALAYGMDWHHAMELHVTTPTIEFKFYQRTGVITWPKKSTGSVRSWNDTSLPAHRTSPWDGSKRTRGLRSKTRPKPMA